MARYRVMRRFAGSGVSYAQGQLIDVDEGAWPNLLKLCKTGFLQPAGAPAEFGVAGDVPKNAGDWPVHAVKRQRMRRRATRPPKPKGA